MKVLVTGATGFVGQELVPRLSERFPSSEMLLMSRNTDRAELLFPIESYPNLQISSSEDWSRIVDFRPEVVIHLASFNSSKDDAESIHKLFESNVVFGVDLLEKLGQIKSVKFFINTGSFSQLDWPLNGDKAKAKNAYFYSATKGAFEIFLSFFSSRDGFKYIDAIPFSIYGGKKTVKRVIDYIIEAVTSPEPVSMTSGEQILDFIHVVDVVEFYCDALEAYRDGVSFANGETYYLGTGNGHSIRELSQMIEKITGKSCNIAWGDIPYRDRDIMYAVAPLEENPTDIKWSPKTELFGGLTSYLREYNG